MNKRTDGLYALAAAIVVAAVLIVGAPLQNLLWLVLVVACPLMMFFMMRGMHGQDMHGGRDQHRDDPDGDPYPSSSGPEEPMRRHNHHAGPSRP